MRRFLSELMQSTDKFKAGATTLEVIHYPEKYISAKYSSNLSNLELEGLISPATGSGSFRFDVKWRARVPMSRGAEQRIDIFIDTKNYSSADNMFKDLGQFKAYLRAIDSFDQLYIIQQGGRGIAREQVIARLERAIVKDAEGVFRAKPELWKNMGIDSFEDLERLCRTRELSQNPKYRLLGNIILTTK